MTVAELAARLKVDEVKAEKLLSQLAVHDRTRIDVDDDAEIRYSVAPATVSASKVRIATTEEKFQELERAEQAAKEEAGAPDEKEIRLIDEAEAEAQQILSSPFPRPTRR